MTEKTLLSEPAAAGSGVPDSAEEHGSTRAAEGFGPLISAEETPLRPLRQQIYERIRASGRIARIDLARDLGVSPASVTATAAELLAAGLIDEVASPRREGESGRGRPPVALAVRPEAGVVAGIKFSDRSHAAIIVDFSGRVLGEARISRRASVQEASAVVEDAARLIAEACARAGISPQALDAIGAGMPGVVEHHTGTVLWSPILRERNAALGAMLAARLARPVRIDNDANLVTLAELWFGAGRGLPDFAVVTIEHGVGMGLVLGHRLWRGAQGLGMELGHTKVQLDGALCRCGKRGCLEAYVADYALVREATTALGWGDRAVQSPTILLESLYDHAKAGNEAARAIFKRAGRYLALGLANVVNLFDPPLIFLSGERLRYDYLYAEEVLRAMAAMKLETGRPAPQVEIRAWGDQLWARGAAALALDAATAAKLGAEAA
ncbi:Sugar kinase of the NBD/HSP70 family, may contain an N-terminal HTH domain [Meinhardsimonia xiamenensis]|jgi:predicted NBD/HSP70 family sugar kinase|uniref:Sugar kinase of the NBD/HSP70 family, may contain an N-terminal HTH domain n=1 Tax=Meinhardsimonia xiamenensis TaxID=990712 RepID=A0A1G9DDH0_9RHOB|nr:ROK family protein [Meinhardsimonia xiamenensis]PRX38029.1 putative NBD/HSP70 family sugar kinase [Meinhardsimonia xiamenensis]SDK61941.1 Sugar kinase of the NBD/HSP70 family, may contain an N-terminal HTH domain [Meinhardsimonia xiamenensis]